MTASPLNLVTLLSVALALCGGVAEAQWDRALHKGVPLKDGKPNLSAPAPRATDGRPDLSGVWQARPGLKAPKCEGGGCAFLFADIKNGLTTSEEIPFQPWALQLYNQRQDGSHEDEDPDANCLSQGTPKINMVPFPFKVIQNPGLTAILYEAFGQYRQIFTDGRKAPADPIPTWLGYSVGRWDRDTFVVYSTGFNGKSWLDEKGVPTSEQLKVTERFRRRDFGHMDIDVTIDDPTTFTKPWSVLQPLVLLPDDDLLEQVCLENERDEVHLKKILHPEGK